MIIIMHFVQYVMFQDAELYNIGIIDKIILLIWLIDICLSINIIE